MVQAEHLAYLESARDQLKDARRAFEDRSYASCAFFAAQSAENATSSLILALGATPSKKHRNSLVLAKLLASLSENQQEGVSGIVERMRRLEMHVTRARYPIRKGTQLLPPSKYYTEGMARRALDDAAAVLRLVEQALKVRLASAALRQLR